MKADLRIVKSIQKINDTVEETKEKQEEIINKQSLLEKEQEVSNNKIDSIIQSQEDLTKKQQDNKKELEDKIENIRLTPGPKGEKGDKGDTIQGPKGDKGDSIEGPRGPRGERGERGVPGKDGKDGIDGIDGIGIYNVEINDKGELIVTLTDGQKINCGVVKGKDGIGYSGISVTNAKIENGHLIITLSNGRKIDAGVISGGGDIGEETDPIFTSSPSYSITNNDITNWNNKSDFSGSYNDLTDKPNLFSGSYNDLTNKPELFSGDYNDLDNKPVIPTVPTNVSAFTNDAGYLTEHQSLSGYATEQWVEIQGYLTQHQDISGKEDKANKVTSISSNSTDTEYASAKSVYTAINNKFFYINVSSSNTTTTTWSELYEAYSNEKIILAKIDYMQGLTTIPVIEPLYLVVGNQSGGTFMFTFVMGTSSINYMVTGTGNNVCTITKQEKAFEETTNKVQSVVSNSASTTHYPSTKAVYDEFQRKPVIVWESSTPSEYLKAVQSNLSASPSWQLTNLDLTPYKRIKIYSCAGQSTGTTASASTTPAIVLEMSLDERARIGAYGNNYVASTVVQKPNDANRLATLTCAVSSDKTSFVVLRQTNLYGTAATSNNDVNANVFMIEGYYD